MDPWTVVMQIVEKEVNLAFPLGHHLHCLVAQIPNHLRRSESGWAQAEPDRKWDQVRSILELVAAGKGNLKKLSFLMLPEAAVPFDRFDELLTFVDKKFRPNTVTMCGVEQVRLKTYRALLERFREDNREAIELVDLDIDSGDVLEIPVNWCCTAIKEATGRLRVFLEAKSHPFSGEELLDKLQDL